MYEGLVVMIGPSLFSFQNGIQSLIYVKKYLPRGLNSGTSRIFKRKNMERVEKLFYLYQNIIIRLVDR